MTLDERENIYKPMDGGQTDTQMWSYMGQLLFNQRMPWDVIYCLL